MDSYNHPPLANESCITRRDFTKIVSRAFVLTVAVPTMDLVAGNQTSAIVEDSLGRRVWLDGPVTRVSPLGINAQTMITTLVPNCLATLALDVEGDSEAYKDANLGSIAELPESGALCTPSGEPVSELVLESAEPDLLIDAGIPRDGLAEELDALQHEVGIPCFFLDIGFGKLAAAYRTLGKLLYCESRSDDLAAFIEDANEMVCDVAMRAGKPCRALYASRRDGLSVRSGVEVQIGAMRHIGIDPVVDAYDYEGKTIDIAAASEADLDLVVFGSSSCLESLLSREGALFDAWEYVPTVAQGRFVVCPTLMHSWFGSMVFAQSLGMLWLADVVWPDACEYDLVELTGEFYQLFYGLEKPARELISLIGEYDRDGYARE